MSRLRAAAVIAIVVGVAQVVPVARTNPPAAGNPIAPLQVAECLRRACYDCHSNETRWPWYSRIAPVSWLVSRHVQVARARLNFSDWTDYAYDPGTESDKLREIAAMIGNGTMPPWYYRLTHPRARLSTADRTTIFAWIERERRTADAKLH